MKTTTLNLDLGDRSYPIEIGTGLLGQSETPPIAWQVARSPS